MTMTLAEEINTMQARLQRLELKNESDVLMIGMLQDQNAELTQELSATKTRYELQLATLRRERDSANDKASKVKILLDDTARRLIAGLGVMKADDLPRVINGSDDKRLPDASFREIAR